MKKHCLCILAFFLSLTSLSTANIVAIYDIEEVVTETGKNSENILNFNAKRPLTHYDICRSLSAAARDKDVSAIVLDLDNASISLPQAQEMTRLLATCRENDKDIWLYSEHLSFTHLLIGSAANHFTLMPEGSTSIRGVYSQSLYFKNFLDKIGVNVEVIHIGDYKSAGEPLYRTGPSKPAEAQKAALIQSMFDNLKSQICTTRGIEPEVLDRLINKADLSPQELLDAKLIDHLEYRTNTVANIRKAYPENTKYEHHYQLPNPNGPEIKGIFDIFKLINGKPQQKQGTPYIAVIALEGTISDQSIAPVRAQIIGAKEDPQCKALVLRINSPGGSALASEVLWEATKQFKDTNRPFVVSMGGVAASGGYYAATAAQRIYAEPTTITGSIGVVGMKVVVAGAMDKLGITHHDFQIGDHSDLMSMTRPYTDAQKQLVTDLMLDVYAIFKKRVTTGRKGKLTKDLDAIAGGRVYSGTQALELGLVDKLGGLQDAIDHAIQLTKLDPSELRTQLLPEPMQPMQALFQRPQKLNKEFIQAARTPSSFDLQLRNHFIENPATKLLDPSQQLQIRHTYDLLLSIREHCIQLTM